MIWAKIVARCRRLWPGRYDFPAVKPPYLNEEWSATPALAKDDPVAAIIRATDSHTSTLDQVSYEPASGTAILTFIQADEADEHWEHRLCLTFSDVRSFGIGSASQAVCQGAEVLSLSCERAPKGYDVTVLLGTMGLMWAIKLVFGKLRYDRSPRRPWE